MNNAGERFDIDEFLSRCEEISNSDEYLVGEEYKRLRRLSKKEFMSEKRFDLFYYLFEDSWFEAMMDKGDVKKSICYFKELKEAIKGIEEGILKAIEDSGDRISLYSKYLETIYRLHSELDMSVDSAKEKISEIYKKDFRGEELSLLDRIFYYGARGLILEKSLDEEYKGLDDFFKNIK